MGTDAHGNVCRVIENNTAQPFCRSPQDKRGGFYCPCPRPSCGLRCPPPSLPQESVSASERRTRTLVTVPYVAVMNPKHFFMVVKVERKWLSSYRSCLFSKATLSIAVFPRRYSPLSSPHPRRPANRSLLPKTSVLERVRKSLLSQEITLTLF